MKKDFASRFFMVTTVFAVAVLTFNPAMVFAVTTQNFGACPGGNYTYVWTGNAGQVPTHNIKCPDGTNPGVIGMTQEITDGRVAQEALDQRRAVAVAPSDWDGQWCTLAVTSIGGDDSAAVACIPRKKFESTSYGSGSINAGGSGNTGGDGVVKVNKSEKFYHNLVERGARVDGCVVQSLALEEAERSGVGEAGLTRLAQAVAQCIERSTADSTVIAQALIKEGMNGIIPTSAGTLIIEKPYRYDDGNKWYTVAKWGIPAITLGLAGYAGGGLIDPEGLHGGVLETGAQWKLGILGVASGLVVSTLIEALDDE